MVWNLEAYDFLKQQAVADTVHPSLWLNGKANIEAGIFEVLPGKIYQVRGIDVANLTFVRSKTGWIVIDVTTNTEAASYGLRITEEVLEENIRDNIKAVIISHSHADHFGGIKGIVSEEQVGKAPGQVRIYVPAGFDEETVKENVYAGTAMFHRSKYQFGGDLLAGPKGRVSTGLGLGTFSGTLSYIRPTDFIAEDTTLTIDGLEVEFQLTHGTEAPAEMNKLFSRIPGILGGGELHRNSPQSLSHSGCTAARCGKLVAVYGDCAGTLRQAGRCGVPVPQLAALEHAGNAPWRRGFSPEQCGGVQVYPRPDAASGQSWQNGKGDCTGSGAAGETGKSLVHASVLWLCGNQCAGSVLQISGLL